MLTPVLDLIISIFCSEQQWRACLVVTIQYISDVNGFIACTVLYPSLVDTNVALSI